MESGHLNCKEIVGEMPVEIHGSDVFMALDLDSPAEIQSCKETTTGHSRSNCSFSYGTTVGDC